MIKTEKYLGKIVCDWNELNELLTSHRVNKEKIVFSNGCFDLIHRGHLELLHWAKNQGDILVVGINSDQSVCSLKGSGRPINCLADRAAILAAMECVDYITPFDQTSPVDLIELICPFVMVKGGDYQKPQNVPEYDVVLKNEGEVRLCPLIENYSSSKIIQKIKLHY